jgi:hypothetical protein
MIVWVQLIKVEVYQVVESSEGIIHTSKDRLIGERE